MGKRKVGGGGIDQGGGLKGGGDQTAEMKVKEKK